MATQPYTTTPPPEISLGGIITSNKAGPKKKGAPLVDNNDDGSCAYDLESLAIDARGWDDGKEAIEVGRTASFGYAEATRGDNRRRKKLSSAEEANAVRTCKIDLELSRFRACREQMWQEINIRNCVVGWQLQSGYRVGIVGFVLGATWQGSMRRLRLFRSKHVPIWQRSIIRLY
jgi:hypothetical protein